jgi:hypothetical protein
MRPKVRVLGIGGLVLAAAAIMLLTIPDQGATQKEGEPSEEEFMQMMAPMMTDMMAGMMAGLLDYIAKPEAAQKLAAFTRNYYEELIKQGFTEGEALKIITSVTLPPLSGMR